MISSGGQTVVLRTQMLICHRLPSSNTPFMVLVGLDTVCKQISTTQGAGTSLFGILFAY